MPSERVKEPLSVAFSFKTGTAYTTLVLNMGWDKGLAFTSAAGSALAYSAPVFSNSANATAGGEIDPIRLYPYAGLGIGQTHKFLPFDHYHHPFCVFFQGCKYPYGNVENYTSLWRDWVFVKHNQVFSPAIRAWMASFIVHEVLGLKSGKCYGFNLKHVDTLTRKAERQFLWVINIESLSGLCECDCNPKQPNCRYIQPRTAAPVSKEFPEPLTVNEVK